MAKKHLKYLINDKPVPSVTTILGVIAKPGLEQWYGRLGLAEANKQKDAAAEFGSKVHSAIEAVFHGQEPHYDDDKYKTAVENFKKWADHHIDEWITFEKAVYNDTYLYAGTVDAFATLKGSNKLTLIDFKTSRKIRPEYYLQVVAYAKANRIEDDVLDMSQIEGAIIVHLDPKTLLWEAVNVQLADDLFNVFTACCTLYQWQAKNG